jgi:enamine deaminase RidA (YjgF/YER057c/UK114 family)
VTGARRTAVEVRGLEHPQPIPVAVWAGDLLFSSPIGPRRDDGSIPSALEDQLDVTFANLRRVVAASGTTLDAVGMVQVHLRRRADRDALNVRWVACFPDEPRPARMVSQADLPAGVDVLLTLTAVRP